LAHETVFLGALWGEVKYVICMVRQFMIESVHFCNCNIFFLCWSYILFIFYKQFPIRDCSSIMEDGIINNNTSLSTSINTTGFIKCEEGKETRIFFLRLVHQPIKSSKDFIRARRWSTIFRLVFAISTFFYWYFCMLIRSWSWWIRIWSADRSH